MKSRDGLLNTRHCTRYLVSKSVRIILSITIFLSSFQFQVAEISPRQNGFRRSCIQVFEHCQAPVFLQLSAGKWTGTHQGLPDLQLPDYLVSFLCFPLNQGQQPRCLNPTSALYLPHDFGQVTTPPWASVSSSVKSPLLQGFQKNKVI